MNKQFSCAKFKKFVIILFIVINVLIFFIGNDWKIFIASSLKMLFVFFILTYYYCKKIKLETKKDSDIE